jgi:spoIIIJ-associated protein
MDEKTSGIIEEGKTVKDAVDRGLAALGIAESDAHIIVLDEGPRGILKLLGGRKARVKIVPAVDEDERIQRMVDGLMSRMGLGGQVTVSVGEKRILVSIETAGLDGLLIGRHGQTLDALQHLIDRMVNRNSRERRRVIVDVGGYRKRRGSDRPRRRPRAASRERAFAHRGSGDE